MRDSYGFPRVQALPEIDRASLRVDGVERAGYEFGSGTTRPFVFPLIGTSGRGLTRMGHPDPVGHEHHKSAWFGDEKSPRLAARNWPPSGAAPPPVDRRRALMQECAWPRRAMRERVFGWCQPRSSKSVGGLATGRRWVRFPCAPANHREASCPARRCVGPFAPVVVMADISTNPR